jgi:hypothetical protein
MLKNLYKTSTFAILPVTGFEPLNIRILVKYSATVLPEPIEIKRFLSVNYGFS